MRILVTDATGTVGRHVTRALLAAGHTVSGIAARPHDCLHRNVNFVCGPLRGAILHELANDADVVIHLAPVEASAPGGAGINGVVRVTHAAARAGARLLFVSQAAGEPVLYRQAEMLVSTGWAPNLIIRTAPPAGRQLDWMVCRTVATLLHTKASSRPIRLLHLDDLVRFLVQAVDNDRTGVVDVATSDATNTITAWRLLGSVDAKGIPSRLKRIRSWAQPFAEMDVTALEEDWNFELGWSAAEAMVDTARGLAGRKIAATGAADLPGHVPLPTETRPRVGPGAGKDLRSAAPEGLEGEFDDRVDPRFPVFSAVCLNQALPGPLTPMTLDVQLGGLRTAIRLMSHVLTLGTVVSTEWENRAIALFGHRAYVGVSAHLVAATQLPGWDEQAVANRALGDQAQLAELLPAGRPPLAQGLAGAATKAVATTRALAMLRHLKTDTQVYSAAASAEHLEAIQLATLPGAGLEVRVRLLRDRIRQGWCLTALWLVEAGVSAAAVLPHPGAGVEVSGLCEVMESGRIAAEIGALAAVLRADPELFALARHADLDSVRALPPATAAVMDATLARIAHRGPGDVELANPTFGDDPTMLLLAAADVAAAGPAEPVPKARLSQRRATHAQGFCELAHDTTLRYTRELRIALRELGSRRVAADQIDTVDDVFYLTCDELVTMPADARLRVKRRRTERERLQMLPLPDVIDYACLPIAAIT